ncbi:hypothetical protein STP4a_247 [Salmonella phage STP4-a]|uniref:Uncharacterized protein n=1 Tax=Salmonella phage STP4-a TaxID=1445860 RepID=A0A0B4L948_9CAUD|nr:hypothetical protein STP4a_247 [Salmonella phage STP4-a]AHJ86844.1 hypothetical protein STP4a_247 [Salmonella phage STP4-a]
MITYKSSLDAPPLSRIETEQQRLNICYKSVGVDGQLVQRRIVYSGVNGFIDQWGEYFTREEALIIATNAGQENGL